MWDTTVSLADVGTTRYHGLKIHERSLETKYAYVCHDEAIMNKNSADVKNGPGIDRYPAKGLMIPAGSERSWRMEIEE